MADTGNLLFDISTEVGEEIFRAKKQAMKSKAVEFGKKPGTNIQWRDAVQDNSVFREAELKRLGTEQFLSRWGGEKNGITR